MTYMGMDSTVYMDGPPGLEQQLMMTGTEPRTEPSYGDSAVFEPYVATNQRELTQPQRVRPTPMML
jgi:hypothetical protein